MALFLKHPPRVLICLRERERERQAQVLGIIIQCPGELLAHISFTEPY